mgnify:FL=1
MQQNVIHKLIQQANKLPVLQYDSNLIIFKDNIDATIREVKQRLGVLQTLKAEIDYQLTLTHTDDEELT